MRQQEVSEVIIFETTMFIPLGWLNLDSRGLFALWVRDDLPLLADLGSPTHCQVLRY